MTETAREARNGRGEVMTQTDRERELEEALREASKSLSTLGSILPDRWHSAYAKEKAAEALRALAAPSPTPAPAKDWLANEIQESEKEFAASGESFKQSCALLEADFDTTSPAPARPDLRLEEDAQGRRAMLGGYQMSDEFIPLVRERDVEPEAVTLVREYVNATQGKSPPYPASFFADDLIEAFTKALRRAAGTVTDDLIAAADAARICLKSRDQSEHESRVLAALTAALQAAAKARVS